MKYMTFNSSCAYAGVANMLEHYGVDVEDREIALAMGLPYLFACEGGRYAAGPMLQTADWFHLYLLPRGFLMTETKVDRGAVGEFLKTVSCGMLGIAIPTGGRHAVVYTGRNGGRYCFINNRRRISSEPEVLLLTEEELAAGLGSTAVIATIERTKPQPMEMAGYFEASIEVLEKLKEEISAFCGIERSARELAEARDRLFRAIFLDAVTMLELIGEEELRSRLVVFQRSLTDLIREGKPQLLQNRISIEGVESAIDDYIQLIRRRNGDCGSVSGEGMRHAEEKLSGGRM